MAKLRRNRSLERDFISPILRARALWATRRLLSAQHGTRWERVTRRNCVRLRRVRIHGTLPWLPLPRWDRLKGFHGTVIFYKVLLDYCHSINYYINVLTVCPNRSIHLKSDRNFNLIAAISADNEIKDDNILRSITQFFFFFDDILNYYINFF